MILFFGIFKFLRVVLAVVKTAATIIAIADASRRYAI